MPEAGCRIIDQGHELSIYSQTQNVNTYFMIWLETIGY